MTDKIYTSVIQNLLTENGYTYEAGINHHFLSLSKRGLKGDIELLKNGTAIRDTSSFCTLEIKGDDSLDFLNRISTNDLRGLKPGESIRTIFCSDKGRIIDSVLVVNEGLRFLIFGTGGSSDKLTRWINRYIITDDVNVKDITGSFGSFEIYGPQAQTVIILLSGIKDEEPNRIYNFEFEDKLYSILKYNYAGKSDRYLLFGEPRCFEKLAGYILKYDGPFNIDFVSEAAFQHYNIENITPGETEISDSFNPHEVKLMSEVSLRKGCFIGQEVIARLDTYEKVQKFLVQLEVNEGSKVALPAQLLDADNKDAGVLTSISDYHTNGKVKALGLVRKNHLQKGSVLFTQSGAERISVAVKEL